MSRRLLVIGLLAVTLVVMLGITAEAHYVVIAGQLRWHSFGCELFLKGVGNLFNNPAQVLCFTTVKEVEVGCENPAGNFHTGRAFTNILLPPAEADESDFLPQGKGKVIIIFPDIIWDEQTFVENLAPEVCHPSGNWTPIAAQPLRVTVRLDTCEGAVCVAEPSNVASRLVLDCMLPGEFGVVNRPPADTPFDCTEVLKVHLL